MNRGSTGQSISLLLVFVLLWPGILENGLREKEQKAEKKEGASYMFSRRTEEVQQMRYPLAGRQIAFARLATALALMSVGALAIGALAIGRLVVRSLNIRDGRISRLSIEELEVGRLRVQELITEREQRPQ